MIGFVPLPLTACAAVSPNAKGGLLEPFPVHVSPPSKSIRSPALSDDNFVIAFEMLAQGDASVPSPVVSLPVREEM